MKILWITNIHFPAICLKYNWPIPVTGGWMLSGAMSLLENNEKIKLIVASPYLGTELKKEIIDNITYYLLPIKSNLKYDSKLEDFWTTINEEVNPDIVHIHGTEYPHSLAFLKACNSSNVVVSIQGLVSVYQNYYFGGIDKLDILKTTTLRDIVRRDSLFQQKAKMKKRGVYEIETIRLTKHVIGRTEWDKLHTWHLNPSAKYHFSNETLRSEFYKYQWNIDDCQLYSIFLSQGTYPIKGLHKMIEALPIILRHYPEAQIHVAGMDFLGIPKWRRNGYTNFILNKIKNLNLTNNIRFTGRLNEKEMCQQFLKSHVFVCPSAIENSPNSLGEAQLLGVPSVSANVGGISNMIIDKESGVLYRFDEAEQLAYLVCNIFKDRDFANRLSKNGRTTSMQRHNQIENANSLLNIYNNILAQ